MHVNMHTYITGSDQCAVAHVTQSNQATCFETLKRSHVWEGRGQQVPGYAPPPRPHDPFPRLPGAGWDIAGHMGPMARSWQMGPMGRGLYLTQLTLLT
jgi:hypothetical protein